MVMALKHHLEGGGQFQFDCGIWVGMGLID